MMNLNNTLIKKFNFDIVALYLFFLWKISPGVFAKGFNYDDSHEILISRTESLYDFFIFSDHHFLYSIILYLALYIVPFTKLQIVNLIIVFGIIVLTKKLYKALDFSNLSYILNIIILFSSSIFLDYSLRIKQYTLDYFLSLLLIYFFVKFSKTEITESRLLVIGILISTASLIIVPVFLILFLQHFKKIISGFNFQIIALISLIGFVIYDVAVVRLKVFDEKFIEYYRFSFFKKTSLMDEIINLMNAVLIFFRGISDNGFLPIYLIIFICGLFISYKRIKHLCSSFVYLFILFCFLHLFDIYPVSAGRSMTFLFPFIVIILSTPLTIIDSKKFIIGMFVFSSLVFINFSQTQYPNSYIYNFVNDIQFIDENEIVIVDYYQVPQFSLYANETYTNIKRMSLITDPCLYSSNKINIIFLQGKECNPISFTEIINENYNNYQRIIIIGEENSYNNSDNLQQIMQKLNFSLISNTKLDKNYRLIYEK